MAELDPHSEILSVFTEECICGIKFSVHWGWNTMSQFSRTTVLLCQGLFLCEFCRSVALEEERKCWCGFYEFCQLIFFLLTLVSRRVILHRIVLESVWKGGTGYLTLGSCSTDITHFLFSSSYQHKLGTATTLNLFWWCFLKKLVSILSPQWLPSIQDSFFYGELDYCDCTWACVSLD